MGGECSIVWIEAQLAKERESKNPAPPKPTLTTPQSNK